MKQRKKPGAAPFRMLPPDLYRQPVLHIGCTGWLEAEGCRDVLAYDQQQIRLDLGRWQVTIWGDDLMLESMTRRTVQIRGQVLRTEITYL